MSTATLVARLALTTVLAAAIGIEREVRHKRAGLRTNTLIGLGAAVAVIISKYGFADVVDPGRVVLDPSRVAAQVVSGIGFIGAGIIFVRRDSVHGLTTAAVSWLTAMVGMACGAGLIALAIAATAFHLVVVVGLGLVEARIPSHNARHPRAADVECSDAALPAVLAAVAEAAATHRSLTFDRSPDGARLRLDDVGGEMGERLVEQLGTIDGVKHVTIAPVD